MRTALGRFHDRRLKFYAIYDGLYSEEESEERVLLQHIMTHQWRYICDHVWTNAVSYFRELPARSWISFVATVAKYDKPGDSWLRLPSYDYCLVHFDKVEFIETAYQFQQGE